MVDPTAPKAGQQKLNISRQLALQRQQMERDVAKLQAAVVRLVASRTPGAEIQTRMTSFPLPELSKVMKGEAPETIGRLVLPLDRPVDSESVPLLLDAKGLQRLHQKILSALA